jgi:hypothetical protein
VLVTITRVNGTAGLVSVQYSTPPQQSKDTPPSSSIASSPQDFVAVAATRLVFDEDVSQQVREDTLCCAVLCCAVLCCAVLCCAVRYAMLHAMLYDTMMCSTM